MPSRSTGSRAQDTVATRYIPIINPRTAVPMAMANTCRRLTSPAWIMPVPPLKGLRIVWARSIPYTSS